MIDNGKNISFFNKGDVITRVTPAKLGEKETMDENFQVKIITQEDFSYRGEPLEYIGTTNNMIYLKPLKGYLVSLYKDEYMSLEIERWGDGWEIWINPKEL